MPSSSTNINKCTHDVFLSFRGIDTRDKFTGHLHQALIDKGIYVFIDNELERGKEITPQLLGVIEESRISIVVLSKHYASSSFCLDELVKILECRTSKEQTVIPVFYYVDPTDVEQQRGAFGQEFAKLEAELDKPDIHEDFRLVEEQNEGAAIDIEKVQNWRSALTTIATLSGYHLKEGDHEASAIQNIVNQISKLLHHVTTLHVEENLVGLDSHAEHIHQMLKLESDDMCMLGLHGMGGVGKTTLAKTLFNKWATQSVFDGCCFLENVRESSKNHGLPTLQEKLLREILRDPNLLLGNSNKGTEVIKHRLGCKKVLILIDDVDNIDQLQKLAGKLEWFGAESRIIITTRNSRLLEEHEVKNMYEVRELDDDLAEELFSWHAFKEPQPRETYEELTHRAIRYAQGLPLALKVLGSSLYKRSVQYWDEILEKLGQCWDDQIFNVLKVSYDSLNSEEKTIFLDIAFFFKGKSEDTIVKFLKACGFKGFTGVQTLIEKSLLDRSDGVVWMHDLLQEMGTKIAFENSSRLCIRKADDIPDPDKRTYVEIILLDLRGEEEVRLSWLESLTNLRVLVIRNGRFIKMPKKLPNIIWLEWCNSCLKSISFRSFPSNLFFLEMPCSITKNFVMDIPKAQKFMCLTRLNLRDSKHLREIVIDFSSIPNIQVLDLSLCMKLKKIHKSVGSLKNLENLNLWGCCNLTSLPNLVNNECLKAINLDGCSKLENLPNLPITLTQLTLSSSGIKEIPLFIGNLINLQHIIASNCKNLVSFSNSIYKLLPNTYIHLYSCPKLHQLPESEISVVSSKPTLLFQGYLDLSSNTFVSFPKNTFKFINISRLFLTGCEWLVEIPELPRTLSFLEANCCKSLVIFSQFKFDNGFFGEFCNCNKMLGENEKKSWKEMVEKEWSIKGNEEMRFPWRYSIIVPGNEIPEWFDYAFNCDSTDYHSFQLPSSRFNSNLIAIACSAVFQTPTSIGSGAIVFFDIGYSLNYHRHEFTIQCYLTHLEMKPEHMWLGLECINFEMPKLFEAEEIWCKFHCDDEEVELKRVGVHLIYKKEDDEDMEIAPHYFEATSKLVDEDKEAINEDDEDIEIAPHYFDASSEFVDEDKEAINEDDEDMEIGPHYFDASSEFVDEDKESAFLLFQRTITKFLDELEGPTSHNWKAVNEDEQSSRKWNRMEEYLN